MNDEIIYLGMFNLIHPRFRNRKKYWWYSWLGNE
jgi:hypothetical protein